MDHKTFFDTLENLTDNETDKDSPIKHKGRRQIRDEALETLIWLDDHDPKEAKEAIKTIRRTDPETANALAAELIKRATAADDSEPHGHRSRSLGNDFQSSDVNIGRGAISADISYSSRLNIRDSTIFDNAPLSGFEPPSEAYMHSSPQRIPRVSRTRSDPHSKGLPQLNLNDWNSSNSDLMVDRGNQEEVPSPTAGRGLKRAHETPSILQARPSSRASTTSEESDLDDLNRLADKGMSVPTPKKLRTVSTAPAALGLPLVNNASSMQKPAALKRSATTMARTAPASDPPAKRAKTQPVPKAKKVKGKKGLGINMKPEKRQCLRGLVLYYIPRSLNSAVGKEIRPTRAHEYGATIAQEFHSGITHICIDGGRDWDYARVLRSFDGSHPPRHMKLVNENYIPNCIEHRGMIPVGTRHRIKGHQEALDAIDARELAERKADEDMAFGGGSVQDNEAPETQETPSKAVRDSQDMPPPDTPASLQLKADRRRKQDTPESPGITSPYRQMEFSLVKKLTVKAYVVPSTPPRRRAKPKDVDVPSEEEVTPTRASQSTFGNSHDSESTRDALDEAIEEAKGSAHLPLDDEDESDKEESQDVRHFRKARKSAIQMSPRSWQNTFACMHAGKDANAPKGPNALTISKLEEMATHYETIREEWKGPAYRKAISALRKETGKITTKEDALRLNGVGERLAAKIEDIANTNRLSGLEHAQQNQDNAILRGFLNVYGAGISQARIWMNKGYRTLEDLRTKADLTRNQQIGLDHYEDFLVRIPRREVERHLSFVESIAAEVSSNLEITVGGSYRRGASDCGDIDFLVTSKSEDVSDDTLRELVFKQLIPRLKARNYIKATLATSSSAASKWHGAAELEGATKTCWRRIDFLMVPPREWGAALIYFTGNDIFNRSIRLLASKKGMRLNQHGLFADVMRGPGRERVTEGTLLEGRDEKKIFEILGVPYRPPEQRNIG